MIIKIGFLVNDLKDGWGLAHPEDFTTADIVSVKKNPGDAVTKDDILFEVETDKASQDFVSSVSGTLIRNCYNAGGKWYFGGIEDTPLGKIVIPHLAEIEVDDGGVTKEKAKTETIQKKLKEERTKKRKPRLRGSIINYGKEENFSLGDLLNFTDEDLEGLSDKEEVDEAVKQIFEKYIAGKSLEAEQKVKTDIIPTTGAARAFARKNNIPLENVESTGPEGVILQSDIIHYSKTQTKSHIESQIAQPYDVKGDGMIFQPSREWLTIAHNLEASHFSFEKIEPWLFWVRKTGVRIVPIAGGGPDNYNLSFVLDFKKELSSLFEAFFGYKFRPWLPLAYAVSKTLAEEKFRYMNGYWNADREDPEHDAVVIYNHVHLGFSYDRGIEPSIDIEQKTIGGQRLRILTLHKSETLSVKEFFAGVIDLVMRAEKDTEENKGKLKNIAMKDLRGHTFIFNNIGGAGDSRGVSLLTPGISGIFNVGRIQKDGTVIIEMFFDHRLIDGASKGKFLDAVIVKTKDVLKSVEDELKEKLRTPLQ